MALTVQSAAEDKPKIVFHAAMMVVQNFGFFIMYQNLSLMMPQGPTCSDLQTAIDFMWASCFMVAFLCIGMGYGGHVDDFQTFAGYWLLHLVGGACYTACTIMVPVARWSDDGKACAALLPGLGSKVELVFILHACLYMVYVFSMLSITYFSILKPSGIIGKPKAENSI